jgi:phosphoglycolate phosphatase
MQRLLGDQLPRLVMFDLDGTLLDSVPDLAAAVDSMLLQLNLPAAGIDKVRTWVGNGARTLVERALLSQRPQPATPGDYEAALALFMQAYADNHRFTQVYPGVFECLDWLATRQIPLAVITNKPQRFVGPLLEEKGLAGYFRWVIAGDTLTHQKPDPEALLHVMREAGVTPEHCLFVGDSRNDVLAARAAGVRCVAVSYGYNHGRPVAEEDPDLLLDDLRQMLP